MSPQHEIRVKFQTRNPSVDEHEFYEHLKGIAGLSVVYELSESEFQHYVRFAVWLATPPALYAGKKAIDIVAREVQKWLDKRDTVESVELYGSDGGVVTVVKKEKK
jgi:hypothetical protein